MSLAFFYSGANNLNQEQKNPDKSLGGYMSITPVHNNSINEFFGDISLLGENKCLIETRAIFLKNLGGEKVNLNCWFVQEEGKKSEFEIAVVTTVNGQIEKINTIRDTPQNATFYKPTVVAKSLLATTFHPNATLGIWLRRTILPQEKKTNQQLLDWQQAGFNTKKETCLLKFSWV